ncbi:MAG: Gfo/Idh/MocA family oxidoreductase [Kiritimatiellae bacterium]|nr:Gfo/Idh/MocA family oxidoreductase [Kiritimatiellia bacterium]
MIKVGIVGFGVMGRTHFLAWQAQEGAEVAAVCEANPEVMANATVGGNMDQRSATVDLTGVEVYEDFDKMLAEAGLDAVSITLPTHLHPPFTIKALEAGVHVLCEKPMALNTDACDEMLAATERSGKILMIAQCIRFWPEYAWTKSAIADGRFGKVLSANFDRLSAAPGWSKDSWFADPTKSGGVTLDLHIHDVDYVQYLFGSPQAISASGARFENGMLGHIDSDFGFADNLSVTATASWMMSASYGFCMAFRIALEGASLVFTSGQAPALKVYPAEGEPYHPEMAAGDGYSGEIAHFTALLNGSAEPEITPQQAKESVRMAMEAAAAVG